MGFAVWRLSWCAPPVNAFLSKELPCFPGSVLWVIVLHEPMTLRVDVLNEGQECLFLNVCVAVCRHDAIKYSNATLAPPTDIRPDMHLYWSVD